MTNERFDHMLNETDLQARDLMTYAMSLSESPLRTLMIETATHLAEGLMRVRQARIQAVRLGQGIDQITVIMAANTARMASILQNFPTGPGGTA
jgi:hypothetical protein